jgi:hypothetical protein
MIEIGLKVIGLSKKVITSWIPTMNLGAGTVSSYGSGSTKIVRVVPALAPQFGYRWNTVL